MDHVIKNCRKSLAASARKQNSYNEIDERYRIAINGNGDFELVDISNFNILAIGEKKMQEV